MRVRGRAGPVSRNRRASACSRGAGGSLGFYFYTTAESRAEGEGVQFGGFFSLFPPPSSSFPCHVCSASCTAAPPAGGGSGAGFSLLRVPVAAEPALTCGRVIRRGKPCRSRRVFGNWAAGVEKPPDFGCQGWEPMAAAGGCERHVLTPRRAEGGRRVFGGMLASPPEGCWLCIPPLISRKPLWGGAGCDGGRSSIRVFGMEVVRFQPGLYFFFHAPRRRVYGACVPGPPPALPPLPSPATTLP